MAERKLVNWDIMLQFNRTNDEWVTATTKWHIMRWSGLIQIKQGIRNEMEEKKREKRRDGRKEKRGENRREEKKRKELREERREQKEKRSTALSIVMWIQVE